MSKRKKAEGVETIICDGRIAGLFKGFRNHDTIFKFQGGSSWRQDEYLYEYHYRDSPKATITKVVTTKDRKEILYLEVDGIATPVEVKGAYV